MIVELLTEHHLEFLSLKGGCTGSSESTLVKISNCWKSHVAAQLSFSPFFMVMFLTLNLWGIFFLNCIISWSDSLFCNMHGEYVLN